MSLIETESIILRSYNLAEADKIVVLLTRDHGVVRGVAKGAKRLKSKFGSGLEPFSFVNSTYFEKDTSDLVSIQKIEIDESNFAAASDPDFLQKFSYLGDLLVSFLAPHDPNETVFRMVRAAITTAAADRSTLPAIGVYFELWLLKLSGYLPDWSRCDSCGNGFRGEESASLLSNSHLSCERCRKSHRRLGLEERNLVASALKLSPDAFSIAHASDIDAIGSLSTVLKTMISQAIGREVAAEKPFALKV
jgi:DNA repair protein RecO (recombination protein O)